MVSDNKWLLYLIDNNAGDGTDLGFCPSSPANLRCLSSEECRVCKLIGSNYEGCDVTSTTPVCDPDKDTAQIQTDFSTTTTTAECVGCKKTSKYLGGVGNYIHKHRVCIRYYCWQF